MVRNADELTKAEAAARAETSESTIDRWLRAGRLRGVRRGSRVFVNAADLDRVLGGTPLSNGLKAPTSERHPVRGGAQEALGDEPAKPVKRL
jgi:excisionase family DNA binding protein